MSSADLISHLVRTLEPVRRLWPTRARLALWTALQVIVLLVAGFALGLRGDALDRLADGAFAIEIGVTVALAMAIAAMALLAAVPGREPGRAVASAAVLLAGLALGGAYARQLGGVGDLRQFVAMGWPCAARTVAVAAIPWLALVAAVYRGATLVPGMAGLLAGLASFLFAAASLRMACPVDSAAHLLAWHLTPIVVGLVASLLVGWVCIARRSPLRDSDDAGRRRFDREGRCQNVVAHTKDEKNA